MDRLTASHLLVIYGIVGWMNRGTRFCEYNECAPLTNCLARNTTYYEGERNDHFFETQQCRSCFDKTMHR